MGQVRIDRRTGIRPLRTAVSSAETDLTGSTMSWANFVANYHPQRDGAIGDSAGFTLQGFERQGEIFCDFNDNAGTCGISLYGYGNGGPAQLILSIDTVTAGTAENGEETVRFFGDTIATITTVPSGETTERNGGGANDVSSIQFDTRGFAYLLLLVTAISASDDVRWFLRGIS